MKSQEVNKIINEVVEETGLSRNVVYKVVMSQFGCLRDTMRAGEPDNPDSFESVRFPYFGIFKPKKSIFNRMKGIQQYNEERRRRNLKKYGATNDE